MAKNNIRVCRYQEAEVAELPPEALCANGEFAWEASIEPEDGSWVLFVPKDKKLEPSLWIRVGTNADEGENFGEDVYAAVGSPAHQAYLGELKG